MLVRVEALHAGYGATPVLRDVSLEAGAGEAIAVIGPNGAGKTTLLRTIAGMLKPTRGRALSRWRAWAWSTSRPSASSSRP